MTREEDEEFAEEFSDAARALARAVAELANARSELMSRELDMARLSDSLQRRKNGDKYEP